MRRLLVTLLFVALVALGAVGPAQAAASPVLSVDVPFAFMVGDTVVPAGHYTVQMNRVNSASAIGSLVTLRSDDGAIIRTVMALPGSHCQQKTGAALTFRKYRATYFLAAVESNGLGCELVRTTAEQEMASHPGKGTVALAAE